jgi:hypothetical protein
MALEDILKVQETVQQGDMRDKLAMMSPQQAPMAPQQAPMAPPMPPQQPPMPPQQPPMPPQQPPMASQLDTKQDLNDMLTATMADGDSLAAKALEGLIKKSGALIQGIVEMSQQPIMAAQGGGLMQLAAGGEFSGPVPGDGHGMEDNVMMPIKEGQEQVATLAVSPTEYVVDSYTMAALGNGNPTEGAEVMDEVVENVREKAYGTNQQPNEISGLAALRPMIERV